jgi:type II secretory pathway component GspD/PulD (secretin)
MKTLAPLTPLLLLVMLVASPGAARAQAATEPNQAATAVAVAAGSSLAGTVEVAGAAAPGVDVRLRLMLHGARDIVARTNAAGQFTFTNLPQSKATLIAIKGTEVATAFVEIKPGPNTATVTFAGPTRPSAPADDAHATAPADDARAGVAPDRPQPPASAALDQFCQKAAPPPVFRISFERPAPATPLTLNDVLNQIQESYGVNFAPDPGVPDVKVYSKISNVPWTAALRLVLEQNDLEAQCLDGAIVRIMTRAKSEEIANRLRKSEPLKQVDIQLKYIRASTATDTTGPLQTSGQNDNSAALDKVETAIRKILKSGADDRGDVTRIPGTNIFTITGTESQIERVTGLLAKIDRPQKRVKIDTIIYGASDSALRSVGVKGAAALDSGNTVVGVSSLPPNGGGGSQVPAGNNPRGIPALPGASPNGGLGASSPLLVLGGTSIIGNVQFNAILELGSTKGTVNVQNRNHVFVESGKTVVMKTGQSIPVLTTLANTSGTVPLTSLQYIPATQDVFITPTVIEVPGQTDAEGNPAYQVVLDVRIQNNSINTSLGSFGSSPLPALNQQSLETQIILGNRQTAIIGAGSTTTANYTKNSTPGLSRIPVIGRAFESNESNVGKTYIFFGISVDVLDDGGAVSDPRLAPADALTSPIPPPPAARPGPYDAPRKN